MAEEKKKVYRLFKVAKEFNVGSSTLVEHLEGKGFDVSNSPNEKLSSEMYSILLKEFASEKDLKEKAEQIREQKRESQSVGEDSGPEEQEIFSAEQLRSGILTQKEEKAAQKVEKKPEEKTPVVEEKPAPEKVEKKESASKEEKETPKEESSEESGIKVVGKIDLSQFDKKGRKVKKEPEAKKPEPEEKKEQPAEKPTPKVEKKQEEKPAPKVEKEEKAVEKPSEEKPVVEKKPAAEKTKTPEVTKEDADPDPEKENEVIRASSNAPTLRGLTIKGKIDLPSDKKAKKSSSSSDDDDSKKGKRKRPRRRKKSSTVSTDTSKNKGGAQKGRDKRPKKEEPTEKEIRELMKKTLADIDKRSGKTRQNIRRSVRDRHAKRREAEEKRRQEEASTIEVTEYVTANEFAQLIDVPVTEIITKCMELGLFVSINQRLDSEVIQILADEYNYEVNFIDITDQDYVEEEVEDAPEDLEPRSPIITVMGHVDHGKTSLLDYIRSANVIAGEAGGITQHIGAYEVTRPDGKKITFLDTPGHEAFTAMRARGAKLTDVAIIVVAADDAVMPQTKEAINHAEAAGVPIIFAINKIDKPGADPERIKGQLAEMNYLVEDWGGKYQSQDISAKKGTNVDDLLEKVLLEAEMLDLKANPDKPAKGTVVESRLEKGRGIVATMLVQEGTLQVGDSFVAGIHYGRVRALHDERGKKIKSAGPSQPCEILGLTGTPQAGDRFIAYEKDKQAKEIASKRQELDRQHKIRAKNAGRGLENWSRVIQEGKIQDLNVIIKGDVDGSIEALGDALIKLSTDEVRVTVVMKGVGPISEADVNLASASDAIIIGFQVRPNAQAKRLAEYEEVEIRLYSIIYDAINEIKDAMGGMLSPEIKEEITGSAEVREVFKISKVGTIAGCMVLDGKMARNNPVRLIRDGVVIYNGKLASLKRFKDDVKEVSKGFECGMQIENYNDIKVGDVIESYKKVEVERTL